MKLPIKAYLSNLFSPLPITWQETVLASAVPGWPGEVAVFRDTVDRHERQWHKAHALANRAAMLRPIAANEPDTIYLASLTVLAWDENDFRTIIAAIFARNGVIVAVDDGLTLDGTTDLAQAVATWKQVRKKKRIACVKFTGAQVSAARKKAKAAEGVEKIRPYWGMPSDEWPTLRLRQMAGSVKQPMSYNTIVAHIGYGRDVAQKRYMAALRHKAALAEKQQELT